MRKRVVCLDNFAIGHIENLLPLIEKFSDCFTLIVGNIQNPENWRKVVEGLNVRCMK